MNQIITQHGWCLNSNMWINLKDKFQSKNFYWQDNDRGYYYGKFRDSKWKENNKSNNFKMIICHSLGTRLLKKDVLGKASHAVLINSFFNFIPKTNRRNLIIRTLKKMEKKINKKEFESLIKEFITRAFLPNKLENNYQKFLEMDKKFINSKILLDDFKKLYLEVNDYNFFSKDCKILIIKSKDDLILEENSIENLISSLNHSQNKNPEVIEIKGQGHIVEEFKIFNIIKNWLN